MRIRCILYLFYILSYGGGIRSTISTTAWIVASSASSIRKSNVSFTNNQQNNNHKISHYMKYNNVGGINNVPFRASKEKIRLLMSSSSSSSNTDSTSTATTTTSTTNTNNNKSSSLRSRLSQRLDQVEKERKEEEKAPLLSPHGIYQIHSQQQHMSLIESNPDKLVVIKFKALYCRACASIEQKFITIKNDKNFIDMPIIWAEFTASSKTKEYFQRLGVLSLPTIHFYDGNNGLIENFACGPTKIPILKQKLVSFIQTRVDINTKQLIIKKQSLPIVDTPRRVRDSIAFHDDHLITHEHLNYLHYEMPFFRNLTDYEFEKLLSKAQLQSYLPGDIIIRQGKPGTTFYVIKSGVAEMLIKNRYEDPISTPPNYLGAVVYQLKKFDYFGERALTTCEPYAASVRALEKTRCFAFNVDDIPDTSILSRKRRATKDMVAKLTERYVLPDDYTPTYYPTTSTDKDQNILELLVRFKQIRQAAKCFDYVMNAKPLLGDASEIARRSILVSKLSDSQRRDFVEVFHMADSTNSGTISLLEMRRFMESANRKTHTDEELLDILRKANPLYNTNVSFGIGISLNEFLGVMAEAEFYNLFTEIFQELDISKTGYVRAGDLADVLHGVRDLVNSDDKTKSIIDVEDQDIQIDYEQFAKMLLGAAL